MDTGMIGTASQAKKPEWKKRISSDNLSKYVRGQKYDAHLLEATISDVVSVVIRRHFLHHSQNLDVSEMFSLGFAKAFMKLKESWINPNCDLVVIVYSTARNEIGNYLRKLRKEKCLAPEEFEKVISHEDQEGDFDLRDTLRDGYRQVASRLLELGIRTCSIDTFFPEDKREEPVDYGRRERKTTFDWFSLKSAVIRAATC
jgi:hypothetical protein